MMQIKLDISIAAPPVKPVSATGRSYVTNLHLQVICKFSMLFLPTPSHRPHDVAGGPHLELQDEKTK